jgi:hypothetical protein
VEIGRSQSWRNLLLAARWWHAYPGIQYVLLLKIGPQAKSLQYALYNVALRPMGRRGVCLSAPVVEGTIHRRTVAPADVVFDARQIRSIPQALALPPNVNDPIVVDLRRLMTRVMLSIGRQ